MTLKLGYALSSLLLLGFFVVAMAAQALDGEELEVSRVELATPLVVRSSTAGPAACTRCCARFRTGWTRRRSP